jgi:hypothetical protein
MTGLRWALGEGRKAGNKIAFQTQFLSGLSAFSLLFNSARHCEDDDSPSLRYDLYIGYESGLEEDEAIPFPQGAGLTCF